MEFQTDLLKVKDLIVQAKDILIVTHEHPTFDSIGSSLALYLGLVSLGKKVTIACPDPMTVDASSFVGINKIVADVGKKNFIISLDYVEGSIEKVSYNIEGNTFNLVIEPRTGFPPFAADKVHYSQANGASDVIITVDTIHLGGLKKLYEDNKDLYAAKAVVNIDRHPNNVHFGQINLVDNQASSTAELTGMLLQTLGVSLSEDIATNLLNALYGGTVSFQNPNVTATAFNLAAACVKAGGKRFRRSVSQEEMPRETTASLGGTNPVRSVRPPAPVSAPAYPQPETPAAPVAPHAPASGGATRDTSGQAVQAPADWLKPKIFKSSNLL